ncbi:NUDIX domain-containing protein [Helicobacter cholecystus]|uniref:NUDIX domain-containing protein n=1 Tax=Helicobacter cholecystus TaxID=45498 RepID=UPI0027398769|nr:NUDIX domain-containing protein [Helicobacter cholecystus]
MREIKFLYTSPISSSSFIKPQRLYYQLGDDKYYWDFYQAFDSVGILLFLPKQESLLLLKHYRPCAFLREKKAQSYELCAGLVDKKGKSLEQIAQEEILEECGYGIPLERLVQIHSFFGNVGLTPAKQTLFFATIHEEEKITQGGGEGDENFEPFFLKTSEILDFLKNPNIPKTTSLAYMLQWFYIERMEKNR